MPASRDTLPALPCACASLRRAARAVTQFYDRVMRESGLEVTQFTLLQALDRAGPVTQGKLGEVLAMDSTTLTRTLRPLQKRGWVASRPGRDRRQRYWRLTFAGRKVLHRVEPLWRKAQSRLQHVLGEDGWEALRHSADRVSEVALRI
jgi:DNA-binding MarR family transcriptional regulator